MNDTPSHTPDAAANTVDLDVVYNQLTSIVWSGVFTPRIGWRREGDVAVAQFGDFEDSSQFLVGFLHFWGAIKKEDTDESRGLRGIMCEEALPMRPLYKDVVFPERTRMGVAMELPIPLAIIDPAGLSEIIARQPPLATPEPTEVSAVRPLGATKAGRFWALVGRFTRQ